MKKTLTILAALALTAGLAGCANGSDIERDGEHIGSGYEFKTVVLPDGRELTCLFHNKGYHSSTMSCDWAGAK